MISEQAGKYQGLFSIPMNGNRSYVDVWSFYRHMKLLSLQTIIHLALSFLKVLCTLPSEWHLLKIKCIVDGIFLRDFTSYNEYSLLKH